MLDTWKPRVRRDGITLPKSSFPVPPPSLADLAVRFERAITPRTKVAWQGLVCSSPRR